MSESRAIVRAVQQLRAAGTPFVVATVVAVRGSSYRRPGARLVATAEGRVAGSVSGGCLERNLVRTAFWRTERGPATVRFDATDEESPLGCGGEVDVLLERSDHPRIALLERALASERPAAIATVIRSEAAGLPLATRWALVDDVVRGPTELGPQHLVHALASACRDAIQRRSPGALSLDQGVDVLIEPALPPPHLFVFGAGWDVVPVVLTASRLGWRTTVWEPSAHVESRARFLETEASLLAGDVGLLRERIERCVDPVAVVMGHDLRQDGQALAMLLRSHARYIGLLGPRHRAQRLASPVELTDPRVFAPVGLDLGAETPEEIAVAIVSEILGFLRTRSGEQLRDQATIHARAEAAEAAAE